MCARSVTNISVFIVDDLFCRFYSRHTLSKRILAVLLTVGVVSTLVSMNVMRLPYAVIKTMLYLPLVTPIVAVGALLYLFTTFISLLTAKRLQGYRFHLVDDVWFGEVRLAVVVGDTSMTISRDVRAEGVESPKGVWVRETHMRYEGFVPLEGEFLLSDVTRAIWDEEYALLMVDGKARPLHTGVYRALRIREAPAIPVALGPLGEDGRRRLRALLDERGIPVRRVRR